MKRGCFYSLSINNLVIKGKMILNIPEKSKCFIDNLYFYIKNSKMQKDIVFMHIVLKALFLRENQFKTAKTVKVLLTTCVSV